ncbi:MAG: phosphodiester glycosidase family protein [Bacillota bacterium]
MRLVNILFVFIVAPFLGLGIAFADFNRRVDDMGLPLDKMNTAVETVENHTSNIRRQVARFDRTAAKKEKQLRKQEFKLGELTGKSREHKEMSNQIYEERILAMLGPPIDSYSSGRVEIKVFKLDELGYRGYIAKVKLFDPSVYRVVLAENGLGERETTGDAVARTGAVLGINGGGFYTVVRNGRQLAYPIGNTVIDGKFIGGFNPSNEAFFAGIQKDGNLIGGIFPEKESLTRLDPWQGVSFLPVLIQNGKPLSVPKEWQTTKQPRTIIGEYANGDLIMIVVDGRQTDWSSGVTLERLQFKLAELGVKEGYNLDGGGSSTFVFKGKVLNRPSDGRQRPVVTNIVILP